MTSRYRWELLRGLLTRRMAGRRRKGEKAHQSNHDVQLFVRDLEDRRVLDATGVGVALLPLESSVETSLVAAADVGQFAPAPLASLAAEAIFSASESAEGRLDPPVVSEQRADAAAELLGETISGSAGGKFVVKLRVDNALVEGGHAIIDHSTRLPDELR